MRMYDMRFCWFATVFYIASALSPYPQNTRRAFVAAQEVGEKPFKPEVLNLFWFMDPFKV